MLATEIIEMTIAMIERIRVLRPDSLASMTEMSKRMASAMFRVLSPSMSRVVSCKQTAIRQSISSSRFLLLIERSLKNVRTSENVIINRANVKLSYVLRRSALAVAIGCLSGCAVTPIVNERSTISYDGDQETAGIIQDFENHHSEITPDARDRYNDLLLDHYGILQYPFHKDFGLTKLDSGNYDITPEAKELWYEIKLEQDDLTK